MRADRLIVAARPRAGLGVEFTGVPAPAAARLRRTVAAAVLASAHPLPLAAGIDVLGAAPPAHVRDLELAVALCLVAVARGVRLEGGWTVTGRLRGDGRAYRARGRDAVVDHAPSGVVVPVDSLRAAWCLVCSTAPRAAGPAGCALLMVDDRYL